MSAAPSTAQRLSSFFQHDGLRVQVSLALYTDDRSLVGQGYADYWADHPGMIFDRLF